MALSKGEIFGAPGFVTDTVTAFGGEIIIRAIPIAHPELVRYIRQAGDDNTERSFRTVAGTFILGVIDENGKRLFQFKDADSLRSELNWNEVVEVSNRILELTNDEGDLEEGKEPSEPTPSSEPSTD